MSENVPLVSASQEQLLELGVQALRVIARLKTLSRERAQLMIANPGEFQRQLENLIFDANMVTPETEPVVAKLPVLTVPAKFRFDRSVIVPVSAEWLKRTQSVSKGLLAHRELNVACLSDLFIQKFDNWREACPDGPVKLRYCHLPNSFGGKDIRKRAKRASLHIGLYTILGLLYYPDLLLKDGRANLFYNGDNIVSIRWPQWTKKEDQGWWIGVRPVNHQFLWDVGDRLFVPAKG